MSLTWRCNTLTATAWDERLAAAHDRNVFQTFAWGEYKRSIGWKPERWIALDAGGRVASMCQVLTRSIARWVLLGWAPGGPALGFDDAAGVDHVAEAIHGLVAAYSYRRGAAYIRIHSHHPYDHTLAFSLARHLARPLWSINTGYSSRLDVRPPMVGLLERMSQNHRYYTKRALRHDLQWAASRDERAIIDLTSLYNAMTRTKGVGLARIQPSRVRELCAQLADNAVILVGRRGDLAVAACLTVAFGGRAYTLLHATSEAGRAVGAGYALHYRLIELLKDKGVTEVDLAGLDPRPAASGVDRFKLGFGGGVVAYLGEWEWSRPGWLRWLVDPAIAWKGGRL